MRIPSGVTDQYIYFVALDATDLKTRETGLSSFTVYRSRNGGAAAAFTTPTINETDSSNMPGVYELLLDEDMTIDSGDDSQEMVFHITHSGMAPVTRTIELYRPKITSGETVGVSSGAVSNVTLVATTTTNSDMRGTDNAATASALATAQADLDTITGSDGVTLATTQGNYAPAVAGDEMDLVDAPNATAVTAIQNGLSTHSAADVWSVGTRTLTAGTNIDGSTFTSIPWNSAWDAEVQSECNDALVALNLDHLLSASSVDADVVNNSIIAKMCAKGTSPANFSTYNNDTDSLEALRDWVGDGTNLTEAGGDGDHLTAIDLPDQTMNITGNLSGSVGSVTGNVGGSIGSLATQAKADVNAEVDTALGDYDGPTNTEMEARTVNTATVAKLEAAALGTITGSAITGTLSTTEMTTDLSETTDDHYNGRVVVFTSGDLTGQATVISDYTGSTKLVTMVALTEAPSNSDTFVIV